MQALCDIIPTVNSNLKSLIICDTPWINDECIELFTAYCHKLYKIELQGCLVHITRSGIESISRNCGSILSLSIVSTPINDITLAQGNCCKEQWMLDNRMFPALINNMNSKLRHFALSGFNMLTTDSLIKFLSYFQRTLQSIDFSELSIIDESVLKCIGENCNRLFMLKLNHCIKITDAAICMLLSNKCNIEVLELCGCQQISDVSCDAISKNCPKLSIIKLDNCEKLTEESLSCLSKECKRLSYISMRETALRTLPYVLGSLKYLSFLNVDKCAQLTFPPKEIISKGVGAIQTILREHNISHQIRCMLLGSSQSGKSSIMFALKGEQINNLDGETFGIPVQKWYPLEAGLTYSV